MKIGKIRKREEGEKNKDEDWDSRNKKIGKRFLKRSKRRTRRLKNKKKKASCKEEQRTKKTKEK